MTLTQKTVVALLCSSLLCFACISSAAPIQWSIANGGNGHYYDWVDLDDNGTWHDANTYAQSLTFNGMSGYLASITTAYEDAFIASNFTAQGYLSGNDYDTFGTWVWDGGPEDNVVFQIGFGTNAVYRSTDFMSPSEPNGDGRFLWYFAHADGTSWVNDAPFYKGSAFIEYSGAPVPEPSTILLLGGGLAGLAFYRRKRK